MPRLGVALALAAMVSLALPGRAFADHNADLVVAAQRAYDLATKKLDVGTGRAEEVYAWSEGAGLASGHAGAPRACAAATRAGREAVSRREPGRSSSSARRLKMLQSSSWWRAHQG